MDRVFVVIVLGLRSSEGKMTKKLLFETIQHLLDELFQDVSEDTMEFSAFGDLFEESHLKLHDLFLKTQVCNALPSPFVLKAGYIKKFKIEVQTK